MRKRSLTLLALSAIALTACSYNPFNEFTGINLTIGSGINVVQNHKYLFWEDNDECSGYEIYLYNDTSSSDEPILRTTDHFVEVQDGWVGNKIKVVGYTYDMKNITSLFDIKKKTVVSSSKIKVTTNKVPSSSGTSLIVNNSYLQEQLGTKGYGAIKIPNTVTYVEIRDITNKYHPTFIFDARDDGDVVKIELRSSTLVGTNDLFGPSVFRYDGTNKDVNFYIRVCGKNTITAPNLSSDTGSAIDLPRVTFYDYYDYSEDNKAELTVTGGVSANKNISSGYAIKADRVVSYLSPSMIKLIGGAGFAAVTNGDNGGTGQMPIEPHAQIYATQKNAIGIQAGNGGKGGSAGRGGKAYGYKYLSEITYKKYASSIYRIKEASVGTGGLASGTYISN